MNTIDNPTPSDRKLSEMLLHVVSKAAPQSLFASFNTILFVADFSSYMATGTSISDAQYIRDAWGPAPERIQLIRDSLVKEGRVALSAGEPYSIFNTPSLVALQEPNLSGFTQEEMRILDRSIQVHNATQSPAKLVLTIPCWQFTDENEIIPYESAFLGKPLHKKDAGADIDG